MVSSAYREVLIIFMAFCKRPHRLAGYFATSVVTGNPCGFGYTTFTVFASGSDDVPILSVLTILW
jgi:hypothetical protein